MSLLSAFFSKKKIVRQSAQEQEQACRLAEQTLLECQQRLQQSQTQVDVLNDQLVEKEFALQQATAQLEQANQIREHEVGKWMQRSNKLKTFIDEYKKRTEAKITMLKENCSHAEAEVSRLDRQLAALKSNTTKY
eukprot:m.203645 g.203645  ORF g.203645 m.203645 type:complete len:135 (+) comp16876_c0_seq3:214-618(+)